jgi:cytochrome c oxidase assembly protein subunit 15
VACALPCPWTALGIFHGIVAQSFFALICAIALLHQPLLVSALTLARSPVLVPRGLRSHVLYVTMLIFLQLALGATMRHQHAGLSISDFPLAHGQIWPDTSPASIARYNAERMDVVNQNPITAFQVVLANDPSFGRAVDLSWEWQRLPVSQ